MHVRVLSLQQLCHCELLCDDRLNFQVHSDEMTTNHASSLTNNGILTFHSSLALCFIFKM